MKPKVIRISTVPLSLHLLLQGQLKMLAETYEVLAVSSSGEELHKVAEREGVRTCAIPMERHIAPLKDLIALIRLIILFRKEKPQIVHSLTPINPEKPDVPLNKNDAFQKVQKRRVQEKR